jgi:cyclase
MLLNFTPKKVIDKKYVGDPINAVKIFNEKEVDELIVLDIDATVEQREPDLEMIRNLAIECRMPFCYGGGVKTVEQARKIVSLGAEKVAFSSAALENPQLLKEVGKAIGVQSVVVVLDYKKKKSLFGSSYEIFTHNGKKTSGKKIIDFVKELNKIGVGEIVINSITNDGMMKGYDIEMAEEVREVCDVPLTIFGGAGSLEDIETLIDKFGVIGASAGSLFVFKGKYRAVLISYPSFEERKELYKG